jgi:hypothetical protein
MQSLKDCITPTVNTPGDGGGWVRSRQSSCDAQVTQHVDANVRGSAVLVHLVESMCVTHHCHPLSEASNTAAARPVSLTA